MTDYPFIPLEAEILPPDEMRRRAEAFYRQMDMDRAGAYAYASEVMAGASQNADAQEGMAAFLAKRKPDFSHR